MIADLTLRWVVTVLFAVSAVECLVTLVVARHHRADAIGHGLHLLMSVAMAVMAWPRGAALPTTGPMLLFLAAAAWFVAVAALVATTTVGRLVNGYHAVMMLAMSWMYAVMNGTILPGHGTGHTGAAGGHSGHGGHAGHGGGGGQEMPAVEVAGSHDISEPGYISVVNWLWTVGFAVAAVYWIYRYFATRRAGSAAMTPALFGTLCQAAAAAGMAIVFAVML